jgi:hypothetical protein
MASGQASIPDHPDFLMPHVFHLLNGDYIYLPTYYWPVDEFIYVEIKSSAWYLALNKY